MNRKIKAVLYLTAALAIFTCVSATASGIPSWSAFNQASFSGIHITPILTSGVTDYTLTIDPGATIKIGTTSYKVNWIQSFVVMGKTKNTQFTATEGASSGWCWQDKKRMAGWGGNRKSRLTPGEEKQFHFETLTIPANNMQFGFHIGFQKCNKETTGWYKGDLSNVPEPASLAMLAPGVLALTVATKRRTKKS